MNIVLPLLPTARQLLQLIFLLFKSFGFIPFPLDSYTLQIVPTTCGNVWHVGIPVFQLLCFSALHVGMVLNRHLFYTGLQILNMNDILKYGAQMVAIVLVLINVLLERGIHRSVWVKLNVVREMALPRFSRLLLRQYLFKFYGYAAFCAAIDGMLIYNCATDTEDAVYYLVILILRVFLRLRHLFHMFFIDLLKVHLMQLHHGLVEVTSYMGGLQLSPQGSPEYRTIHDRSVDRLLQLKTVYGLLWDANDRINRAFGWSQICNFTANFVDLSCDFYWCYLATISFGFDAVNVYLLSIVPSAALIVLLLYSAESCLREGTSIGTALLSIPIDNDPILRKIVYRFRLQLSHQRIHLTAHGLFDINYSLLQMIATGITTYMVIFITFSKGIESEDVEEAME